MKKKITVKSSLRPWLIALFFGALSGAIACAVLWLMNAVMHFLWGEEKSALYTFIIILVGGVLIALLRPFTEETSDDIKLSSEMVKFKRKKLLFIALSAIIAVGFGGAIGPEAGLIAIVTEFSAFMGIYLAKNESEVHFLKETGAIAVLSGLYFSPLGVADLAEQREKQHKKFALLLKIVAALGGTLVGVLFMYLKKFFTHLLGKINTKRAQTIVGTIIFALLATAFPLLKFSGHHELMKP